VPQGDPRPVHDLSRSRVALLGVYAADDPELKRELRYLGVDFPEPLDAYAQLRAAAEVRRDEEDRPRIHGLHLAFAAMFVLGDAPRADFREQLEPVAMRLIDPEAPPDVHDDAIRAVLDALERNARVEVAPEERWAQVVQEAGRYLDPELRKIETAWCRPELREVDDEFVSRIETMLVVRDQRTLDQLAPAVLPQNWKYCNDFFCDLTRVEQRDAGCAGVTHGDLSATATHWRGVYEERVGSCPAGWFPDTYLLFTWDRSAHQLILRYELAPRRKNDKTVLKIDQGYIQVDRLSDTYQVSTVKYLLFDDRSIPGGGQSLAQTACPLGWLDYSINQFTVCAQNLASSVTTAPAQPPAGVDAELQRLLDRCHAHLLETASDADAQFGRVMAELRKGSYGLDDWVGDWARVVGRAIRDGSRSLRGQIDFLSQTVDMAREFTRRGGASS
jgi:hypothetical protein